jgi:tRNA-Thr(GGU) m(6)t(6)A37 methyltransferase TsaA
MSHDYVSRKIMLSAVGLVRTSLSDDEIRYRKPGQKSLIEIFPKYKEAFDGLSEFSHIFVISYFHRLRTEQIGPLKVRPRGLLRHGFTIDELPLLGVFSLDSPTRPNPIGLSLVPLVKIDDNQLEVCDLDLFDGTPVLDIKPYQPSYRVENFVLPTWYKTLSGKAGHV